MHSKVKGTLGELAIAQDLIGQGFPTFTELGDNSKVDLIALTPKPIRIQVKALNSINNVVQVSATKSGPNYKFRYSIDDLDIFAIFVLDTKDIFYVSVEEILSNAKTSSFRLASPKNNQIKGCRYVEDYREIRRVLRDYTPNILANNVEDDDIVQTTTSNDG